MEVCLYVGFWFDEWCYTILKIFCIFVVKLNLIKLDSYHICYLLLAVTYDEGQSNENRTPATKWQWNLIYSKVIARSVNTFIPLGDKIINSSLVERGRSLMDPQLHPLLHFLIQMKPTSTNVFFQVEKNVEVTRGKIWAVRRMLKCFPVNLWCLSPTRLTVWGWALSCKRMVPSDSIPGCFDFVACRSFCNVSA